MVGAAVVPGRAETVSLHNATACTQALNYSGDLFPHEALADLPWLLGSGAVRLFLAACLSADIWDR